MISCHSKIDEMCLQIIQKSVTRLVNGFEQYGEDQIYRCDFKYTKRTEIALTFNESGENGQGYYPTVAEDSTFSGESDMIDNDIDE
jgi:hypothetical protein